jgi:phospholipid/cholesterol/gamma-HCH transport system substrate-binding protein
MPNKDKSSLAQLRVGVLGIVALFFISLLIFLLTGSTDWFVKRVPLHVYLSNASGLQGGALVRINGIQAGKVDSVGLSGETNPARIIKVDFDVDHDMLRQIPIDSTASVGSDNLLGSTKFLDVAKGTSLQTVEPGATMRSSGTQEFDQLVKQGFGVLDSAQAILNKISDVVDSIQNGKGTIGKLLVDPTLYNSLQATVAQVQELSATLNSKRGTIGQLINDPTVYNQVEALATQLNDLTRSLQNGEGTIGMLLKDKRLYGDLDQDINQLNGIMADLRAGKGTAGQLLTNGKIANQISSTLDKIDVTLDNANSGQGTIGQLLVNPQLYDAATGTTRELHELLKDFRANPKKFLSIKLHIF